MKRGRRWRQALLVGITGGGLLLQSCLANIQQNLEYVLSSGAVENALRVPYSPVADLALFFAQYFRG